MLPAGEPTEHAIAELGRLCTPGDERVPNEERLDLDVSEIAEAWRRGSVVSSWLLDLCAAALVTDGTLETFSGQVPDSGEGRWTVETAMEQAVGANVLSAALFSRYRSRVQNTFGEKAALRHAPRLRWTRGVEATAGASP